jgi:hypothetical protein
MAPQHKRIYNHLIETRDARAAADMIFAHDAGDNRKSQLFSQVSGLFVEDNSNRRKEYRHELLDLHMEIEETHPEDAGRLFDLLGATLKAQHDAQQKGDFTLSVPELNVRFKAILPCEPYFYEFRKLGASTHHAHRELQGAKVVENHKHPLHLKRVEVERMWQLLLEKAVAHDPREAARIILEDIQKRSRVKKHERTQLHDQEDLNDLLCYCYALIRWATGRRREEILNQGKDYGWEQVEGNRYLMRAKLAKKRCPLGEQKPHTFPVLIESDRIMILLDFVRSQPTARARGEGGQRKTLSEKVGSGDSSDVKLVNKRLDKLFQLVINQKVDRMHARVRALYFHMAWEQREQSRFEPEGESWTFDLFVKNALGHDKFETGEHYKDILLND